MGCGVSKTVATKRDILSPVIVQGFEILEFLGKGTFGKVFKVAKGGKNYALKVLPKASLTNERHLNYILREKEILSSVKSPFVVGFHGSFQTDLALYLVTEYCPGFNFFHILQYIFIEQKKFYISEKIIRFYTAEILEGLQSLHNRGVIYRDLKPENIVFDRDGHIRLIDFGLSSPPAERLTRDSTRRNSIVGTHYYVAPEVIHGKTGYSFSVDFWSLGVFLYELACGHFPLGLDCFLHRRRPERDSKRFKPDFSNTKAKLSKEFQNLVIGLMNPDVHERLGVKGGIQEIRRHPFFKSVDWSKVSSKSQKPPLNPYQMTRMREYFRYVTYRSTMTDAPAPCCSCEGNTETPEFSIVSYKHQAWTIEAESKLKMSQEHHKHIAKVGRKILRKNRWMESSAKEHTSAYSRVPILPKFIVDELSLFLPWENRTKEIALLFTTCDRDKNFISLAAQCLQFFFYDPDGLITMESRDRHYGDGTPTVWVQRIHDGEGSNPVMIMHPTPSTPDSVGKLSMHSPIKLSLKNAMVKHSDLDAVSEDRPTAAIILTGRSLLTRQRPRLQRRGSLPIFDRESSIESISELASTSASRRIIKRRNSIDGLPTLAASRQMKYSGGQHRPLVGSFTMEDAGIHQSIRGKIQPRKKNSFLGSNNKIMPLDDDARLLKTPLAKGSGVDVVSAQPSARVGAKGHGSPNLQGYSRGRRPSLTSASFGGDLSILGLQREDFGSVPSDGSLVGRRRRKSLRSMDESITDGALYSPPWKLVSGAEGEKIIDIERVDEKRRRELMSGATGDFVSVENPSGHTSDALRSEMASSLTRFRKNDPSIEILSSVKSTAA